MAGETNDSLIISKMNELSEGMTRIESRVSSIDKSVSEKFDALDRKYVTHLELVLTQLVVMLIVGIVALGVYVFILLSTHPASVIAPVFTLSRGLFP